MNRAELVHRFALELIVIFICYFSFSVFLTGFWLWFVILITAHSWSAIFNGHPFAVLVHDAGYHSFCYFKDKRKFLDYVEKMDDRLKRRQPKYLAGALVFGSIVKGVFRETSDLDVRFIPNPGFINALLTANLVFIERLRATLCGFPMDLYMFRNERETRQKMDVDNESAVALYSDNLQMEQLFDGISTLDEMSKELLSKETVDSVAKPPRAVAISSGGQYLSGLLTSIEDVPFRATIATVAPECDSASVNKLAWKKLCFNSVENGDASKLRIFYLSVYLILRDRPDYIITTGSLFVVTTCVLGKILGAKVIFLEMAKREADLSEAGKFLYKFSDLFIVKSTDLLQVYPKAKVISFQKEGESKGVLSEMILHFTNRK